MGKSQDNILNEDNRDEIRYIMVAPQNLQPNDDELIDIWEIAKKIWSGRYLILKTILIFIIIGLLDAFSRPETFVSEVKILPEAQQQTSLGGLGGLARQFGVGASISNTREGIPPRLYPDIIQSNLFLSQLLDTEITLPYQKSRIQLRSYFLEHQKVPIRSHVLKYTIGLPFTLLSIVKDLLSPTAESENVVVQNFEESGTNQQIIRLDTKEWQLIELLRFKVSVSESNETGVITIGVELGDPVIAAEVANKVVELLIVYVTDYRIEKAKLDVNFIEDRYHEAKSRFDEAQIELANFTDENRGNLTALARTRQQILQSNYNLTFNLYNSMSERLEESRIKLQEETPIINILENAYVPDNRATPKRAQILVGFTIIGGIFGIGLIFLKKKIESVKQQKVFENS